MEHSLKLPSKMVSQIYKMYQFKVLCTLLAIPFIGCFSKQLAKRSTLSKVTTVGLVQKYDYLVETHSVQSSDGYILTFHRIPSSPKQSTNNNTSRPVAFLMHGLMGSSGDWVVFGPGRSLAFILSDAGYDVWLGNARGNIYSRKHVSLNPLNPAFWKFSWHEIAIYDLPAMINYVLQLTGQSQVHYIGHSQGTTTLLVLASMLPTYNSRIRSAHLLAPVAYITHANSSFLRMGAPLLGKPNAFDLLFGNGEFFPSSKLMKSLGQTACLLSAPTRGICKNVMFLIFGWNSPFMNKTAIPEITSIFPSGASMKQIKHYLQEYNSRRFCQYDYGAFLNKVKYNAIRPPIYQLNNIAVPIYTYYGDNDPWASVIDVKQLEGELKEGTLKGSFKLPHNWNHLDFLAGIGVENILYTQLMANLNKS